MSYLIRGGQIEDAGLIASIIRNAFRDVAEQFGLTKHNAPRHPSNCTYDWIAAAMEKGVQHYVLESDGVACGCVALEKMSVEVCYLERLGVIPDFRGNGFGKILVNHVIHTCRDLRVHRVEIGIIAEDRRLRNWYEHLGFTQTRTAFFAHLPFEVAFMARDLRT